MRDARLVAAGCRDRGRDPVHARARPAPGLHRRAGRRRPRRHARRDGRPRRRPGARQPARAGRPGHRPLGPGRPVPDGPARSRSTSSASTSATASATSCCAGRRPRSRDLRVVPPGTGIVHQVNLEYLAPVVATARGRRRDRSPSPTRSSAPTRTRRWSTASACWATASAASRQRPCCSASRSTSRCRASSACACSATCRAARPPRTSSWSSTDMLRAHGVVGAFVEFAGDGLAVAGAGRPGDDLEHVARVRRDRRALPDRRRDARLPAPDRPRPAELIALVEALRQGAGPLARARAPAPTSTRRSSSTSATRRADASPDRAGRRTRSSLAAICRANFRAATRTPSERRDAARRPADQRGRPTVDSRTARSAVDGRRPDGRRSSTARSPSRRSRRAPTRATRRSWSAPACSRETRSRAACRSSRRSRRRLAPGSRAVTEYLERGRPAGAARAARLRRRRLRLHDVHRQQRPARRADRQAPSRSNDLVVAAVLSGNRNFEGRIHPLARASYLASPPLVVAFALAGRVEIDLTTSRWARDRDGKPVFLADIWPTPEEIRETIAEAVDAGHLPAHLRRRLRRRRALARAARSRRATATTGTRPRPTSRGRRSSTASRREPAPVARHRGRARARAARRLGHDRPHLPGRLDPALEPGRPVAAGARRRAARVQLATARGAATTR